MKLISFIDNPKQELCPKCQGPLRYSARRFWDFYAERRGYVARRCRDCRLRMYIARDNGQYGSENSNQRVPRPHHRKKKRSQE